MKSAIHLIISITLVTAVLAACQSPQTRRNIATADSLSEADPAAAINFIDNVSPAADGRRARMKMALLKAKAMNKLMQPIDSAKLRQTRKCWLTISRPALTSTKTTPLWPCNISMKPLNRQTQRITTVILRP